MDIIFIVNGFVGALSAFLGGLAICLDIVAMRLTSLEVVANAATILASVIALGAILAWGKGKYYEAKPFCLKRAYSTHFKPEFPVVDFWVDVENRLPCVVRIDRASLYSRKLYTFRDIEGRLSINRAVRKLADADLGKKGESEVGPGGLKEFTFRLGLEDSRMIHKETGSICLFTDRGFFYVPISSFKAIGAEPGKVINYSDSSGSSIWFLVKVIRYFCWRYLLSEYLKKKFVKRG
tara:strand:+ start:330 stop:1037 length:708 start_codon:yes stop_codon:yes gene_type:complete